MYIVQSIHIALMYVIKHSVIQVTRRKYHSLKLGCVIHIYSCYICRTTSNINILLGACVCVCVCRFLM